MDVIDDPSALILLPIACLSAIFLVGARPARNAAFSKSHKADVHETIIDAAGFWQNARARKLAILVVVLLALVSRCFAIGWFATADSSVRWPLVSNLLMTLFWVSIYTFLNAAFCGATIIFFTVHHHGHSGFVIVRASRVVPAPIFQLT